MTGYFYILLATSVCGTVCIMLSGGGFERYIKYLAALISLLLMISPLKGIDISKIQPNAQIKEELKENMLNKTAEEIATEQTKSYINQEVLSEFGIKPTNVSISIDWEREDPTVTNITVAMPKGTPQIQLIKEYLTTLLGGEVTVIEA